MKKINELNKTELEQVVGGTFTPNMFDESVYNRYGIKTNYHPWDPDEFWLPDGTKTNEKGANEYIRMVDPIYYDLVNKPLDDYEDELCPL